MFCGECNHEKKDHDRAGQKCGVSFDEENGQERFCNCPGYEPEDDDEEDD